MASTKTPIDELKDMITALGARFDAMETRFDAMDTNVAALTLQMANCMDRLADVEVRCVRYRKYLQSSIGDASEDASDDE